VSVLFSKLWKNLHEIRVTCSLKCDRRAVDTAQGLICIGPRFNLQYHKKGKREEGKNRRRGERGIEMS
jgi:hypothetical protein